MAKKWEMTHEQTEIGFDVLKVEKATKKGFVVVSVKYPITETIYTYVRKFTSEPFGSFKTVIDGCEVTFNNEYNVIGTTRIYDTKGLRRTTTENIVGSKGTTSKIKDEMEEKAIKVPTVEKAPVTVNYHEEAKHEMYNTIKTCLTSNIPIYLAGPAGSGKNYTVEQICNELGWEFYFSNSVQQEYKLTGFIDAGGKFHETEFFKACTSENECVFFLDEMDASIPEVLVLLNAAIANGYFEFPTGRVEFDKVHFVAAGNTVGSGADEMYTGRTVLDQATLDRFAIIEFDYSVNVELSISKGNQDLVTFVHELRNVAKHNGVRATFSYRCITMVTKLEAAGMDMKSILQIAVVKGLDKDTISTLRTSTNTKYDTALRELRTAA